MLTITSAAVVVCACRYVCDPVLGDHNQYYVPAALVDIFRTQLIPRYCNTPILP